jgi:hypothetical protein
MLELNFHDETGKSKTFETQRTEDAEEAGSRERKLKLAGGDLNLRADRPMLLQNARPACRTKRSGRGLQPIMELIPDSAKHRCEVIVPVR